ncbi:phytanoyl-CoA dioxygenase family protein [Microlunatus sp. Y2014]|uniref:phytanoyl-CoA dioxygenase family protein n=1 Tax=Microlunatus sp. Y2014 TaxID=3418488 RepID=UPI003DA706B6
MTNTIDQTAPTIRTATTRLSRDEVEQFHRYGYVGPFEAMDPDEMAGIRSRIETDVLTSTGWNQRNPLQSRHLDQPLVYDLITRPALLDRIRSLIGDDVVVWASYFFNKEPGGREIPWHQDANFWPIEPALNISVWMAVDEVTTENSCVQLIPGSHRSVVPHVKADAAMQFGAEADPALIDTSQAVNMELRPGQFFIFNERMLHHSDPNRSDRRRMGLSVRYTPPFVKLLDQDEPPLFPGHACVVVSGKDDFQLNRVAPPPTA